MDHADDHAQRGLDNSTLVLNLLHPRYTLDAEGAKP
jgi:hypothetical protein